MLSFRSIALATTAAAALVPAAASAKTYCVFDPDCTGTPVWSIQDAIDDAAYDNEAVRIELGEGTYSFNAVVPEHLQGLEIVGKGQEQTVVEPNEGDTYILELHNATVSHVGFKLPYIGINGPHGLFLADGASADHIGVVVPGVYQAEPVRIEHGGHLSHSYIDAAQNPAVQVTSYQGTGDATITDSYVSGGTPIMVDNANHTVTANRDHFVMTGDYSGGVFVTEGKAVVEDSLIDMRGHSDAAGLKAQAGYGPNATITGRHLTVLADGTGTAGVAAESSAGLGAASVSLSDSVLDGVKTRARRGFDGVAILALARVDTWPPAPDSVNGATFSDAGSFSADPLLTTDFAPRAGSPLIDAAAPLATGESDTDVFGSPRTIDGDGNCDSRPDIGAVEAPAGTCAPAAPPVAPGADPGAEPAPVTDAVAPVLSHLRLSAKRLATFALSERATVRLALRRCANRTCSKTRKPARTRAMTLSAGAEHVRFGRVRPGRYVLRVTAVDAVGNRATPQKTSRRLS
jgi:hypothetical protein